MTPTASVPEQAAHVGGLADVLHAVVRDAHEPHPERDGRVPSPVDDSIEVGRLERFEERAGARATRRPDSRSALARRAGGSSRPARRCGRSRCSAGRARGPCASAQSLRDPQLVLVDELGDVVVLHAGEVPHEPRDGVPALTRRRGELRRRRGRRRPPPRGVDAAVELEQQRGDVHGQESRRRTQT